MPCNNPYQFYKKKITNHFQLTDIEFERRFESTDLPPNLFTHEAHIRLAWIHILKYGEEKAVSKICEQILNFDNVHGKGDKFHMTVTVAAVKMVNHFIKKSQSNDFKVFIKEFPRLKAAFKELLEFHYGFDIFSSEKAKVDFVTPDLLPFN